MMASGQNVVQEQNKGGKKHLAIDTDKSTVYVGGLDSIVSESLLWELFEQVGPIVNVHMPRNPISLNHKGYAFIEFRSEKYAKNAIQKLNMYLLYDKPIRVDKALSKTKIPDVGACVFVGNLNPEVDEKLLYDTFSAFGTIRHTPKLKRFPRSESSMGFAYINYSSFEASDAAIAGMNGQRLCNRRLSVKYAYKKNSYGERHGSDADRLAAQRLLKQTVKRTDGYIIPHSTQTEPPNQVFTDLPPTLAPVVQPPLVSIDNNPDMWPLPGIVPIKYLPVPGIPADIMLPAPRPPQGYRIFF